MSASKFARNFRTDIHFFGLTTLTWLCFDFSMHTNNALWFSFCFALGASIFAVFILKLLGYFSSIRVLPRQSDLLLVLFAMPLGGCMQYSLTDTFFGFTGVSVYTILFWSPIYALVIFGGHYLLSWVMLKNKRRRKIVLDMLPSEKKFIIEDFTDMKMAKYIEFLNTSDLKEHFLRGSENEIDLIIISRAAVHRFDEDSILIRAHTCGIPILDRRQVTNQLTGRICLRDSDLWSYVLTATHQSAPLRLYSRFKTIIESVVALVLIFVFAPLMALIAASIKLTSQGPIIYKQIRTGYQGRIFSLVKFRSMRTDSELNGPQWANRDDDRATFVGKILRKTRLDELPQLFNVVTGEMSFFGPRPERPEICKELKKSIPLFALRTIVRPGITGWAQVCAGYAASVEESLLKLEYDLYYIQHMSPRLDAIILFKTILVIFSHSETPRRVNETVRHTSGIVAGVLKPSRT